MQGYTKRRTENATCQSQGLHRPCRSCRSKHLCRSPSPSPIREGGLHVLIVSFHERFRFPFSTFRRSLAGAPEGSRVQRSPGPKLLALFRQYFRNLPASSVSHINPWNAWNNGALLVCAEQRDFYRSSSKNPNRPLLMTENERTSFKEVVRSIRSRVRQGAQDAKRSDRRRSD